jgi:hypothetical protein
MAVTLTQESGENGECWYRDELTSPTSGQLRLHAAAGTCRDAETQNGRRQ